MTSILERTYQLMVVHARGPWTLRVCLNARTSNRVSSVCEDLDRAPVAWYGAPARRNATAGMLTSGEVMDHSSLDRARQSVGRLENELIDGIRRRRRLAPCVPAFAARCSASASRPWAASSPPAAATTRVRARAPMAARTADGGTDATDAPAPAASSRVARCGRLADARAARSTRSPWTTSAATRPSPSRSSTSAARARAPLSRRCSPSRWTPERRRQRVDLQAPLRRQVARRLAVHLGRRRRHARPPGAGQPRRLHRRGRHQGRRRPHRRGHAATPPTASSRTRCRCGTRSRSSRPPTIAPGTTLDQRPDRHRPVQARQVRRRHRRHVRAQRRTGGAARRTSTRVEFVFSDDIDTQITGVLGGQADAIVLFAVVGGDALLEQRRASSSSRSRVPRTASCG